VMMKVMACALALALVALATVASAQDDVVEGEMAPYAGGGYYGGSYGGGKYDKKPDGFLRPQYGGRYGGGKYDYDWKDKKVYYSKDEIEEHKPACFPIEDGAKFTEDFGVITTLKKDHKAWSHGDHKHCLYKPPPPPKSYYQQYKEEHETPHKPSYYKPKKPYYKPEPKPEPVCEMFTVSHIKKETFTLTRTFPHKNEHGPECVAEYLCSLEAKELREALCVFKSVNYKSCISEDTNSIAKVKFHAEPHPIWNGYDKLATEPDVCLADKVSIQIVESTKEMSSIRVYVASSEGNEEKKKDKKEYKKDYYY